MKRNILREKLNNDEPTLSTHIHTTWPSVVEALGHTGKYDYVEFVAEYGSFDLHDLDNLCRAAELYNMGSMIKVDQSHQGFLAQRGIGAGCTSVLFTDARSADDVKECIKIAKPDTPESKGLYGVATRRHTYMGYGGSPEYVKALNETVIAIMIEKNGAVENLEEILEIPGVDMVQWGGSDYSMSIGKPGAKSDPQVIEAHDKVFKTSIKMGIPPRAEIKSVDEAKKYLDMGVKHFSIGTDISILHDYWKQNGDELRRIIS
ncbi:MAG: 2,4-dihydroxyhept-2-ene-1,7-dioic acid aldolase [SAR202 cluster bacterium]|nr:2,4-dihydroxyhept-2-ene-1,7-dioic acid aldolase [Chloroflexota bacterium]MQG38854.1 2,4-dihydroxyhept-2-ene-1,7-dioic acid aldolase [SAR202 cluster bacterium]|tara:strand:- start:19 stop:801 length:783 start_codon:yes stop_codon:yes gene_type:complete